LNQIGRVYNRSKDLLFNPALDRYWRRQLSGLVICLLYHRVDSPSNNQFLSMGGSPVISPCDLDRELRFLKTQGAMFLTFADLRNGVFPGDSEFGVIISFDDCFLDNYTYGLEVLENLGIKGVFFQTTGMIEPKELIWEHTLYWLNRSDDLSRSFTLLARRVLSKLKGVDCRHGSDLITFLRENVDLATVEHLISCAKSELSLTEESGAVVQRIYPKASHVRNAHELGHEIGSHGHVHAKRQNIDDARFDAELAASSRTLANILGTKPKAFSYPFNSYNDDDSGICARYFQQAATVDKQCIRRDTDPMWLPRFTWPGPTRGQLRQRRWLLTGTI
jgi:peptidoglycan/xylan/chitin deacetylase (PgdA/CDA1 family)